MSPSSHAVRRPAALREHDVLVTYRVRSEAAAIEARAKVLAVEQSVEMPLEAIGDRRIIEDVVGEVRGIDEVSAGVFDVRIALAGSTLPPEPGQMLNMLFGNSSLHDDVMLADVAFPDSYAAALGGPRLGLDGLRRRLGLAVAGRGQRALTATALKPQGSSPETLARLAHQMALGTLDIIKDDHGIADQGYSPFAARVAACARAVRAGNASTGRNALYAPSLSGSLDELRRQLALLREEGVAAALVAPMVVGLPAFHALARESGGIALIAHPSLGGAQRIAPPLLIGRLFRLFGADATIFPNHGGRFSYSPETCAGIAARALEPFAGLARTVPAPAGGMTLARVPELLDFYGRDCMLLIGGSLLAERDRLSEAARDFATRVERHDYR